MKKLILLFFLACATQLYAQDYKALAEKEYKTAEEYKSVEADVLSACNLYLSKTLAQTDSNRVYGMLLAIKWAMGTPDYQFVFDDTFEKIGKADKVSSLTYMICMTKYVLEHKDKKDDVKNVKYNTVLLFLKYANNPKNEIPAKGEIKKLQAAQQAGKLKEYLAK
ncbi:hypothetical protein [Cytophaga aurantiaca]|uniref:hypothetical protein n=1 Tax=Cytophaga aurantiaca TaxID=29530 RepID=UPI00035C7B74|nr:hypothetical protein [Cytophaga aurantiaca]